MTPHAWRHDELYSLFDSLCDGSISENAAAQLDEFLLNDADARWEYLCYLDVHASLGLTDPDNALPGTIVEARGSDTLPSKGVHDRKDREPVVSDLWPVASDEPPVLSCPFILTSPSPPPASLLSTYILSYTIATVIFAIAAVIGSNTYVTHYTQVAHDSAPIGTSNPQSLTPSTSPDVEFVGRITGMVDCKWDGKAASGQWSAASDIRHSDFDIRHSSLIALGDKLSLSSGLLEITYNTGAKVLLQGPVAYEVDSEAGGYLSLGKLTARVEKGSGVKGQGSGEEVAGVGMQNANCKMQIANCQPPNPEIPKSRNPKIPNPQSLIPNPFVIKTPTATVTDLGTEFGVEVNALGNTMSHVYRGSVKLEITSTDGVSQSAARILYANESAQVRKNDSGKETAIYSIAVAPETFVRTKQLPSIVKELVKKSILKAVPPLASI